MTIIPCISVKVVAATALTSASRGMWPASRQRAVKLDDIGLGVAITGAGSIVQDRVAQCLSPGLQRNPGRVVSRGESSDPAPAGGRAVTRGRHRGAEASQPHTGWLPAVAAGSSATACSGSGDQGW